MFERINLLAFLGITLIILGLILILIPIFQKLASSLERIHPLLIIGRRIDGVYIGTSPLLIIILIVIYALLLMRR